MQTLSPATIVPPNVTADMLTELIARYPTSESRIHRGAALVRAGHVEWSPVVGMTLVVSATDQHRAYHVDAASCGCADHQSRGVFCQHMAARALWMTALREETDAELDAEQSDPTPDAPDTYYCVLCEAPIPAAEVVETRWGFMHERCAASEPHDAEQITARYELTGRGYLTLVPTAALPNPVGTITRQPTPAHLVPLSEELFGPEPAA